QGAALAGVAQALVRDLDRLDQADPDSGGFVVVVLAPDGVGDELRRVACPLAGHPRGDEQEEMALGARLRSDARLDVERGVRRIWGVLGVGNDTELHLGPVGHWVLAASLLGRGGIIALG